MLYFPRGHLSTHKRYIVFIVLMSILTLFSCFCVNGSVKLQLKSIGLSLIVLTPVAAVNEAIQKLNPSQLIEKLNSAGLTSVEDCLCNRYLRHFISAMDHKIRVGMKMFLKNDGALPAEKSRDISFVTLSIAGIWSGKT